MAVVLVAAGCDNPPPPLGDAATQDGSTDACEGRTLCTAEGARCEGDRLVTCARDADGCLVESEVDCGASGQVCDESGGTAACVDPCSLIPAADRCDTEGARACNGDTLEVCSMNAQGCLVLERTDCTAAPGGSCDASGAMPVCVMPADPCADVPEADRCTTAGTSCDGDSLVTCAPNAFGCLVRTVTDCTSRPGGTCDASGTPACTATSPCDGIEQCAAEGARCDGPDLVVCAPDAFGCLVETRTTCTDAPFGFCDEDASPSPMCSTAATDPCMGVTECAGPSRECTDRSTLVVCAPNAFGCFVETTTDCTTSGDVCSDSSGTAVCVDPCSLVPVCPGGGNYCDGDELVTCAPDADGCLVPTGRVTCSTNQACALLDGTAMCAPRCDEAGPRVLTCASGTVTGDTAMGTAANPGRYGSCHSTGNYGGNEQYWRFLSGRTNPVLVTVTSSAPGTTRDFDLFVLDAGDGSVACTDGAGGCLGSGRSTGAAETVDFTAAPGQTAYVVFDLWATPTDATTTYELTVSCVDIICGDGVIHPGEECDDGGTAPGDGCDASCSVEPGYLCVGTPSVCDLAPPGSTCDAARSVTGDATFTGENITVGGPRPTDTSCSPTTGTGANAFYYAVTIPPATRVEVTTAGSLNRVLLVQDACGGECTYRSDVSPERTVLV
ncbi:MAG TPA: hypothetical protein VIL20_15810, partial [Sandaracinaceae bacterium]